MPCFSLRIKGHQIEGVRCMKTALVPSIDHFPPNLTPENLRFWSLKQSQLFRDTDGNFNSSDLSDLDEGTSITEDAKISDQDHANISGFENAEKSHP